MMKKITILILLVILLSSCKGGDLYGGKYSPMITHTEVFYVEGMPCMGIDYVNMSKGNVGYHGLVCDWSKLDGNK
jgi:hypothetical protein